MAVPPPFWTRTPQDVLADLASTPGGLSEEEARSRLKRFGPNEPAPPRRFEPLREVAAYLVNPLVLILLCASAVSAIFGQIVSSAIVATMVLLSIVLNFTQTYHSQVAARRLRERSRAGRRAAPLEPGLVSQRGGAHRRVAPAGETRRGAGAPRRSDRGGADRGDAGHIGSQWARRGGDGPHRSPHRVRPSGVAPGRAAARDRVRARDPHVRDADPQSRPHAGLLRFSRQRALPARSARILSLRGSPRRRA